MQNTGYCSLTESNQRETFIQCLHTPSPHTHTVCPMPLRSDASTHCGWWHSLHIHAVTAQSRTADKGPGYPSLCEWCNIGLTRVCATKCQGTAMNTSLVQHRHQRGVYMGLFVAYFSVIFFKNEREAYAITSLAVCPPPLLHQLINCHEIQRVWHVIEDDLDFTIFNPIASTILKWRRLKLLRWIQYLH
jgi:hypothetical protein